jgi:hypothetical protein
VAALLIERDPAGSGSPLGAWIPFMKIFLVTITVEGIESASHMASQGGAATQHATE